MLTLSNIRYVSRVKWSNLGKGVAPSPTSRCSSYWKGSLLVALDYGCQLCFTLLIFKGVLVLYLLTGVYVIIILYRNIYCCFAEKDNTYVWKYNQLLFFSFYYPKCKGGLKMAVLHTQGLKYKSVVEPLLV